MGLRRLAAAGLRHRGLLGLAWAGERYLEAGDRRAAKRYAREALDSGRVSAWVRETLKCTGLMTLYNLDEHLLPAVNVQ